MSVGQSGYLTYRQERQDSHYPFSTRATLTNSAGDVLLEGTFLDLILHPVEGQAGAYLSQVEVTSSSVTIRFGDGAAEVRCQGTFSIFDLPSEVRLVDRYGLPAGLIVSEPLRLSALASWSLGLHRFRPAQTELAVFCCLPQPEPALRGFVLDDGTVVSGEVWLVGDRGVVLKVETEAATACTPERLLLKVHVVGDPLFRRDICAPQNLFQTPRFLRRLRILGPGGVDFTLLPDQFGFVQFFADNGGLVSETALRILPLTNQLDIQIAGHGG